MDETHYLYYFETGHHSFNVFTTVAYYFIPLNGYYYVRKCLQLFFTRRYLITSTYLYIIRKGYKRQQTNKTNGYDETEGLNVMSRQ